MQLILDFFTVGAGVCCPTIRPKANGDSTLCLTFFGGCDPGDYIEIDLKETANGFLVDGVPVALEYLLDYLDELSDRKREKAATE